MKRKDHRSHVLEWACFFAISETLLLVYPALGQTVYFDVSPVIACAEADDIESPASFPGEQLIEARCQVSVLLAQITDDALGNCLFHFYSAEPQIRVHDYSPKTLLVTDVVGNLRFSRDQENASGLQLNAGSKLEALAQAQLGVTDNSRSGTAITYDQLPPRETLSAAGTLGRGAGVYFKQHRTSQTSLEGAREFVLILRVPEGWRAGYLRLVCQARSLSRSWDTDGKLIASASFLVPLYRAGDIEARSAAIALLNAEHDLIVESEQHQHEIKRARRPTMMHELALADPVFPENWLNILLRTPAEAEPYPFESRLPVALRPALQQYRHAKLSLRQFGGSLHSNRNPVDEKDVDITLNPETPSEPGHRSLAVDAVLDTMAD